MHSHFLCELSRYTRLLYYYNYNYNKVISFLFQKQRTHFINLFCKSAFQPSHHDQSLLSVGNTMRNKGRGWSSLHGSSTSLWLIAIIALIITVLKKPTRLLCFERNCVCEISHQSKCPCPACLIPHFEPRCCNYVFAGWQSEELLRLQKNKK